MGKVKARKVHKLTPKKKCCRSKPRCLRCPLVIHKMQKVEGKDLSKKDQKKALKKARHH